MSEVKQIRFKIINGINDKSEILYSRYYDLLDITDYKLAKMTCNNNIIIGFSIEISINDKTDCNNKDEFEIFIEYIAADDKDSYFLFMNQSFQKMPYHIIGTSILDVNDDVNLLFSEVIPGNIEETMFMLTEIFGTQKKKKLTKISNLFKKINKF